jgi:hypothetical protein
MGRAAACASARQLRRDDSGARHGARGDAVSALLAN